MVDVKSEYPSAVIAAVKYIEAHLDEDLSPGAIANHVAFSPFHFHRIFQAVLGESVKEYVRKRRLDVAARQLQTTQTPILDLAIASGFDSQEAFTRAFKKMFGTTPGAFRKYPPGSSPIRKPVATEALVQHLRSGITMEPKIIKRGPELAIGMGASFVPGATEDIGKLWGEFVKRRDEIKHCKPYDLGVCMGNHPTITKAPGDSFIYVSACAVEKVDSVPAGMVLCEIPEATYALFTHKGPIANIKHTVDYIWGTWIHESGYKLLETPDFELYDDRFCPETGSGEVDIYVPIESK